MLCQLLYVFVHMIILTMYFTICFLCGVLRKVVRDWGPSTPPSHLLVPPQPLSTSEVVSRKTGTLWGWNQSEQGDLLSVLHFQHQKWQFVTSELSETLGSGGGGTRRQQREVWWGDLTSLTCPIHSPFTLKTAYASQGLWICMMLTSCEWVRISCLHP